MATYILMVTDRIAGGRLEHLNPPIVIGEFTRKRSLVAACKKHRAELGLNNMEAFQENAEPFIHEGRDTDPAYSMFLDDMRFFLELGWIKCVYNAREQKKWGVEIS